MPGPSNNLKRMKAIKVGDWADFGPYERGLSDSLRHSLQNAKRTGRASKGLQVVTSKDDTGKRIIVVHLPEKV